MKTLRPSPRSRRPLPALSPEQIRRMIRFGLVGALGTLLNSVLVWLLLSLAQKTGDLDPSSHLTASVAAVIAWIFCCGTNYLLNAAWTFRQGPPTWVQAGHYYVAAFSAFLIQLALLNGLLLLLDTTRPIETAALNGVAVATGALFNYLFTSLWVFGNQNNLTSP